MALLPQAITGDSNHSGVTRFYGFALRENAGTPAVAAVNFRLETVSGTILWPVELAANESAGIMFPEPIVASAGVYVQVVAGSVEGTLYSA